MLELIKDKKIALRFIELMPLKNSDRNTKMNELIEYVQKNYILNVYDHKLGNGPSIWNKHNFKRPTLLKRTRLQS